MYRALLASVFLIIFAATGTAQEIATLKTDRLEVDVSLQSPRILEYRLRETGGRILGSVGAGSPSVVVCARGGQRQTISWASLVPQITRTDNSVVFACTAKIGQTTAATFDYAIRVRGHVVTIEMENIRESGGWDLNEFLFSPDPLIRVSSDLPGASVCVGDLGASGAIAAPGEKLAEQYHFGLLCTAKAAAGIYTNSLYRQGQKPVRTLAGNGSTGLYANHHRYSFKDENYEPFKCQIGIVADENRDGTIDWKDAACFIHNAIPNRVKLHQDSIKYMMNHGMDFESAPEGVYRKICNMADGHPQMVLLSGWNGWGWDSEYPTWNQPGEEYGGREGLYYLHNNSHKYRAYTSMIHNFDDAYKNTRMWDQSIIARRSDGSLWNATWWSGGPSFIIGPYRFGKTGKMKETIDGLISQGMERQIFSDVFTILPWRSDEDPVDGADAETNLVLGKLKLLDYLAEHDIYMNSEGFNYEMLGRYIGAHNGYNAGFTRDANRPPLALFICHGLLAKKMWSPSDEGRFRGEDTEVPTPFNADNVYRWSMLISFYGEKPMRDFRVTPEGYLARYGDDVEVLWKQQPRPAETTAPVSGRSGRSGSGGNVSVKLAGRMIADGASVLLPKPDLDENMWDVLRAYSSTGATMRYSKPSNWTDLSKLAVMALTFDNPPQVVSADGILKTGPDTQAIVKSTIEGNKLVIRQALPGAAESTRFAAITFAGDELVLDIPKDQPLKLIYGPQLVEGEKVFQPVPPRKPITYPLEEVIERIGGGDRPNWVRLKTRKTLQLEPGVVLCVGASAIWPTRDQATKHAADIIAKKMAWAVRQSYVNRAREVERELKTTTDALGYDNWQLGYDGAVKLLTIDGINARQGIQWYCEKVKAGFDRKEGWKAFVCVPCRAIDGQRVFIESVKMRLAECQDQLKTNPSPGQRTRLELNIKVYEHILEAEGKRNPIPLKFQV